MKRVTLKKMLSLLLVGGMASSVLAGCGKDTSSVASSVGDQPVKQSTAQTDTQDTDGEEEELGYPISKDGLTLQIWTPMSSVAATYIRDYSENEAYQEMEKRTGVKMEFIHPAVGQEVESFNVMMASDELPDIINCGGGRYKGGESAGVDDGVFADLTPYIEKYAPDYYKLVTSDPELLREVTDEKGRFIGFYKVKPVGDPPFRRVMYRTEWMEELGLDVPRTLDDYEVLLKALKEKKGVVPLLLPKNGYEEQFMGMYGVLSGFYLKDGKNVAFGQIQPEFKQYLELMHRWYEEGYIGADFPTMDMAQQQSLFDSGSLGLIIDACVATLNRGLKLGYTADSSPYPRLEEDQQLHWEKADAFPQGGELTVISAKSKHIEEAVRWLNYGYSEEGSLLLNYGVEGKTWNMVDGKPQYTDYALNNEDYPGDVANYVLKVLFSAKMTYPDVECSITMAKTPEAQAMRKKWGDDPKVDSMFIIPPIKLTSEESDQQAKIMNDINTYCDEMTLKFITGEAPLDEYDNFVAQVEALGIADAVKIQQTAYDRYMGN